MKKSSAAIVVCVVLATALALLAHVASRANAAQPPAGIKRYQIASAIVEYTLSGIQNGTETLYFTDYGMREAKYTRTELKVGTFTQKTNRVTILDGATTYTIDLDAKTGTKVETPLYKNLEGKDATEVGEKMLRDMGGQKIGAESFLGKMCDVWEIKSLGSKTWLWSGIPLKTETKFAGTQNFVSATKLEPNAQIPPDKLALPADVKISAGVDFKMLRKAAPKKTQQ
ncbi:MAG: hypothetical protein AAB354_17465 [candidate division KSB1 bacterium]